VTQGVRTLLEKSAGAAGALRSHLDTASEGVRDQVFPSTLRSATFLAVATGAPDLSIPTLNSIRWKDDRIVVFGRLVPHP
jgi:hypothetical protein